MSDLDDPRECRICRTAELEGHVEQHIAQAVAADPNGGGTTMTCVGCGQEPATLGPKCAAKQFFEVMPGHHWERLRAIVEGLKTVSLGLAEAARSVERIVGVPEVGQSPKVPS